MEGGDCGTGSSSTSKKDFAWQYTVKIAEEKYFRCRFCNQVCSGTINRMKHHLAGTHKGIKACSKVPNNVREKCKKALDDSTNEKTQRENVLHEIRISVASRPEVGDADISLTESTQRMPRARGPMDSFTTSQARNATLNSRWKEERREVCRSIGRFCYSAGLSFNIANDPYYKPMFEAIANFGPGFTPPTMHELKTWILKDEVEVVNKMLEEHKKAWSKYGCSIMSDSWTDGKSRTLINFLVNSLAGTFFLKSIDASDAVKTGELLFTFLDGVIGEVGEQNVVQIITDNDSNYINAGKKIMEKYDHIYWTPCAAHCIDLMLEDIGKLKIHESTLARAKQVVKFIYGHTWVLDLMRSFTKDRELIRPAITRFVTAFLTLQSLHKQKQALQSMFLSEAWCSSQWAKKPEGIKARATILFDKHFWGHMAYCIRSTIPLVCVLRDFDSEERPAMGYIYELMDSTKKKIAVNCGQNERKYGPVWMKIDARWEVLLHKPLHAAGYYLNPQYRFEDAFSTDDEVKQGLLACMERMLPYGDRLKADIQLDMYDNQRGDFGSRVAMDSRKLRSPADWWLRFGGKTPELTHFAVRVLSLTCSLSRCERNWSTFESIHTKKKNRLEHKRLNSLVYVRYNTRLRERSIKRKQNFDPVLVEDIASNDEWIVEKEESVLPQQLFWLEEEDDLLNVDVVRNIPTSDVNEPISNMTSSVEAENTAPVRKEAYITYSHRKRKVPEGSKGKEKEIVSAPEDDFDVNELVIDINRKKKHGDFN